MWLFCLGFNYYLYLSIMVVFKTYDCLKRNQDNLMTGQFHVKDLDKAKHISFLLNNLTINMDNGVAYFEYEDITIRLRNVMIDDTIELENFILSTFIKQPDFIKAYNKYESTY